MPSLIRRRTSLVKNTRGRLVEHVAWHVQIPVGLKPDGKREYLRKTFGKESEAKAFVAERLEERKTGGVVKPSEKLVSEYLPEWLEATKSSLRENTAASYLHLINQHLVPELGKRRLCDLTPLMIQRAYRRLLDKGLSPRTVRYAGGVLHSALEQAVRWRMLSTNPAKAAQLPKHKATREMRPLSQEEAKAFLKAAKGHRLGPFFEVALTTGMRPSELFGLKWTDVDLDSGVIQVRHSLIRADGEWKLRETKTKRGRRSIPLAPQTVETLREWKAGQGKRRLKLGKDWHDHGFVFSNTVGNPLEIRNVANRALLSICKKADLVEVIKPPEEKPKQKPKYKALITLYDLRHSCATLMLAAGVNPKVASERLGHSTAAFTLDVYSHVLPGMQETATEKLGRMLYQ